MLVLLDHLLRDLFLARVPQITAQAQVRFQPPDQALRAFVTALNDEVISVYLAEVRENRELRSNAADRADQLGEVWEQRAPERLDCHYLISAFSPAQAAPMGPEPTEVEHELLYDVAAALLLEQPLNPSRLYASTSPEYAAWGNQVGEDLPTRVAPESGFDKLGEFWSSMGQAERWRPPIHAVVTVPVLMAQRQVGPMVTTSITEFRIDGAASSTETMVQIGGHVRDGTASNPTPVEGAWVRLETSTGALLQYTSTDVDGRFTFLRLSPAQGHYRLHAGSQGFGPLTRAIDVPSETGEYDLVLT